MKRSAIGALAIVAALGSWAAAQYYGGAYINNKASTPGESHARGMSDMVRSQGMANLANSEAAINMTEATKRNMENRDQWTDTYFQMRQKNRDYRAAERRPRASREDFVRMAAAGRPSKLSPSDLDSVTGEIDWPRALTRPEFADSRTTLENLFAKRAAYGQSTWKDSSQIAAITKKMEEDLKKVIRDVPPSDYTASKRFLDSLAYENQQPAS
jgi:ubiquitin